MVASILQFSAIVAPLLRPTSAIAPVLLLFYATVAVVLQAASATILTDPIDPHLCRHLQQQQQSNHGDGASSSSVTPVTTSTTVWRNPLHQPPIITPPLSSNTNTNKRKRIGLVDRLYYRANVYRQSLPPPVYSTAEDNTQQRQQAPTMKHCWICDVTVSAQSMHCKFCNKCVANFDHHCMCKYGIQSQQWESSLQKRRFTRELRNNKKKHNRKHYLRVLLFSRCSHGFYARFFSLFQSFSEWGFGWGVCLAFCTSPNNDDNPTIDKNQHKFNNTTKQGSIHALVRPTIRHFTARCYPCAPWRLFILRYNCPCWLTLYATTAKPKWSKIRGSVIRSLFWYCWFSL